MKPNIEIVNIPDDAVDVKIITGCLTYTVNGVEPEELKWVGMESKLLFTRSTATEEQQKEVESKGIKWNYCVIEK